jgi:predicted transcriptional regulator
MSIGYEIEKLRRNLWMTQLDFAKEIGISQTIVSQYEKGIKRPSPRTIKKIILFAKLKKQKFEITIEDILDE